MFRRKLRFFLHRWHRRLGLSAVIVILMVSITGILLNHTGQFDLAKHYPQSQFWLWPYPAQSNVGIKLSKHTAFQASETIYLNQQAVYNCEPPLISAIEIDKQVWMLCKKQLLLFQDEKLVEVIDIQLLGDDINNLAEADQKVHLRNGTQWFLFDDISLMLSEQTKAPAVIPELSVLSDSEQINRSVHWQKVILDLHSGRFFGPFGVYIVDAAAIILLMLSLSGFWIWYSRLK